MARVASLRRVGLLAVASLTVLPTYRLTAQCPDGAPPPCAGAGGAHLAGPAPTSVAVLYFENLSSDTTDLYLANGITEEPTSQLGAVNAWAPPGARRL